MMDLSAGSAVQAASTMVRGRPHDKLTATARKGGGHGGNRTAVFRAASAYQPVPAAQRPGGRGARHRGGEPGGGALLPLVPARAAGRGGGPHHRDRRAR